MAFENPFGQTCQETAGFLFSHECTRPVAQTCMRCGKTLCAQHTRSLGAEVVCIACARENQASQEDSQSTDTHPNDDPYLYSSYYYDGYGYHRHQPWGGGDANDFTEADGESLQREGDMGFGFEEDMGGS